VREVSEGFGDADAVVGGVVEGFVEGASATILPAVRPRLDFERERDTSTTRIVLPGGGTTGATDFGSFRLAV
jgi:hypothetical protein